MVRIQLASNFQVIELTYDNWDAVNVEEISNATQMVNTLGKEVINDIKSAPKTVEKKEEMITDKQKSLLVGKYKFRPIDVEKLTKKEAWNLINEVKEQQ